MTRPTDALAPCPHCGCNVTNATGEGLAVKGFTDGWTVTCRECGATGPLCFGGESAIAAWNSRASPVQADAREAFEAYWLRDHFDLRTSAASIAWQAFQAGCASRASRAQEAPAPALPQVLVGGFAFRLIEAPGVPPDEVQFRDSSGKLLAKIVNIGDTASPPPPAAPEQQPRQRLKSRRAERETT